jgi:hypothetical protein
MNTKEKMDQLSEFEAQRTLLSLKKNELLDQVKVPIEVLAAQDEANKQRQKLDRDALKIQKEIQSWTVELMSEVIDPEMPPEFMEALSKARAQREDIQSQATQRYEALHKKLTEQKVAIDSNLLANVQDVYNQVAQRKDEISAEFGDKAEAIEDNIAKLTAEIKAEVIELGASVKSDFYHAVYVKGRTTWNTDLLDGMIIAFPALEKARKVGAPSVTLRKI